MLPEQLNGLLRALWANIIIALSGTPSLALVARGFLPNPNVSVVVQSILYIQSSLSQVSKFIYIKINRCFVLEIFNCKQIALLLFAIEHVLPSFSSKFAFNWWLLFFLTGCCFVTYYTRKAALEVTAATKLLLFLIQFYIHARLRTICTTWKNCLR